MELDRLARDLDRLRSELRIPVACVATLRNGSIETVPFGEKASADTIFEAASLTKPVFAAAVLELAESSILDLDRPLSSYPGARVPLADPLASRATARHVLSHQSGFPNWLHDSSSTLLAAPGTSFSYSGEAYNYLQSVLEAVLQEPLETWLAHLVLAPAGMSGSFLSWQPHLSAGFAAPHSCSGERLAMADRETMAAGTLFCSVADYARYLRFLIKRDSLLRQMLCPHTYVAPGISWGLGWALSGNLAFHWGDNPGYKHLAVLDPSSSLGLVIFTNSDAGSKLHLEAASRMFPAAALVAWLARAYEP